ncbi:hypothetical protein DVH24_019347 [Malus domestica]|uniref:Uncharacterized protein n=1 Tax=Malus domestica TaxID=3750 RepID=A0A498I0N1_MALDO|nr:hypothetical protein DVH24_019347 [Malus domestica]
MNSVYRGTPNLDNDIQEKLDSIVVIDPLVCDNPKLLGGSDSAPSLPSEQFDSDHDLANTATLGIPMTSLNSSHHYGRIWVSWNPSKLSMSKLEATDQVIHSNIKLLEPRLVLFASVIYASNDVVMRRRYFNITRRCNETAGGSQRFTSVMEDFASCLFNTEFDNLNATGIFYSWSNKRDDSECILRKLDRVLVVTSKECKRS